MPFVTSGASLRHLPLFFAYCPDRAGVLAKRLAVRPGHLARWKEDLDNGRGGELRLVLCICCPLPLARAYMTGRRRAGDGRRASARAGGRRAARAANAWNLALRAEFGLGLKPPPGAASLLTPDLPPGSPELAGSVMLIRAENLERAWDRIRGDLYWTEGVWDQDKCRVEQFTTNPLYHDSD